MELRGDRAPGGHADHGLRHGLDEARVADDVRGGDVRDRLRAVSAGAYV